MYRALGLVLAVMLVAACGGDSSDQPAQMSPAAGTTGGTTAPKGELRLAFGIHMPGTLDSTKDGFTLVFTGMGETLTRLTRDNKAEPWLAERVSQIDPTTWRVTLRSNARFHDGTPVTAADVVASFRRNWETQPAASGYIPKETEVTAIDERTVEFKTPRPIGAFENNLAAFQFVVHKPGGDRSIMTGPYRPVRLVVDSEVTLEAFPEHWGGPPPIATIVIKSVPDANARALALQSGDVDMVFLMPPEMAKGLSDDFERAIIPSTRIQSVIFNHQRLPFSDRAVREAFALGVDRDALNRVTLEGAGAPAINLFPQGMGIDVVPAQATDVNKAKQLLDNAGWWAGPDGVRVKDGKRLSFTLFSYPGRAELTPMAVQIQSQLKNLGFAIEVEQIPFSALDSNYFKTGDWDASMYSVGTLPTGDPLYMFNQNIVTGAPGNIGGYSSPQLDAIVEQMRVEIDPTKRNALVRQAQEIVKVDVPMAYLVAAPVTYVYKKGKVKGFVPNPNDQYFIDSSISVD
ncbi:MAG: ABC transporter substrate-binding protein [Dehalococcoidia bacterium]